MKSTRSSGTVPPKPASKEKTIVPIQQNQLGVYDIISYVHDGEMCFGMVTEVHENKTDIFNESLLISVENPFHDHAFLAGLEVLKHGNVSGLDGTKLALNKGSSWSKAATLGSIELVPGKIDATYYCEKSTNLRDNLKCALSLLFRNISIPRDVANFHSRCGFLSDDSDLSSMDSRHKVQTITTAGVSSKQIKYHDPPIPTEHTNMFGYESPAKKCRTWPSPPVVSVDRNKKLPCRDKSNSCLSAFKSISEPLSSDELFSEADVALKNGTTDDLQEERTKSDKSDIVYDNHSDKVSIIEILSSSSDDDSVIEIFSAGAYSVLY